MSVINVTDNGWLVVWWKTISTFYIPKHSCQEHKIDVSHVWSQCMLFIDYWPIHCILTTRQIRKLIQNIHRPEVAAIRISRVRHRPVARGTVCDTLGCNVHTHTRNEWPKWLCGEYECALVSIVRPFTWYTLYHYYWYAASYGTIRVNQVVRKRYQCFVWRLVVLSPSAATMKTLAPVAWKTCCECWQPDSGHNSSPNMTSMYIEHLPVNIWLDDI